MKKSESFDFFRLKLIFFFRNIEANSKKFDLLISDQFIDKNHNFETHFYSKKVQIELFSMLISHQSSHCP